MHSIIQFIEFGIVVCIFIMCASGVAGIFYISKKILRWEQEDGCCNCPDKLEPRE